MLFPYLKPLYKGPWIFLFSFLYGVAFDPLSFTTGEMVFASKLSDKNRQQFCYVFTEEERARALLVSKGSSPDEGVAQVVASYNASERQMGQEVTEERSLKLPCDLIEASIDDVRNEQNGE